MNQDVAISFLAYFKKLKDPRIERCKRYTLAEILLLVLCAVICGTDSFRGMVQYGQYKLEFLRGFLPYKNGIPRKSTLARVLSALTPEIFKVSFTSWANTFKLPQNSVIAIDGKALRHSHDHANDLPAIYMVSAFASESRLVLGQQKVDSKSNEITAVPALLKLIDVKGNIVTLDAMGCQRATVADIIDRGGDYAISLKGNQGNLHKAVALYLNSVADEKLQDPGSVTFESIDKGHGRIEVRKCLITASIDWLDQKKDWKGLQSIAMIESTRILKNKTEHERRFFITSLPANAELFASVSRQHWAIENNLHWGLDMVFGEDASRVRNRNAAENLAIIRHFTVNLIQQAKKVHPVKDISLKIIRACAMMDDTYLEKILTQIL